MILKELNSCSTSQAIPHHFWNPKLITLHNEAITILYLEPDEPSPNLDTQFLSDSFQYHSSTCA